MIAGEYLVLAGATALAIPVGYAQQLSVTKKSTDKPLLNWTAREKGKVWFRAVFESENLTCITCTQDDTAQTLRNILQTARSMNHSFLRGNYIWDAETDLEFPLSWGLGSSSTLLANIAQWSGTNPYRLLFLTLGGSGYDVACALHDKALLYQYRGTEMQPIIQPIDFLPPFADQLYFVYSGQKQDTRTSLHGFSPERMPAELVRQVSGLSHQIAEATTLPVFTDLMQQHEELIGNAIGQVPLQKLRFADFEGQVKSLGAWGGDFFLVASEMKKESLMHYFHSKGCQHVIPFGEMVLANN
jgi:mevalonate kinase